MYKLLLLIISLYIWIPERYLILYFQFIQRMIFHLFSHLHNHITNISKKFSYWRLFYLDCHFFYAINQIFMKAETKIEHRIQIQIHTYIICHNKDRWFPIYCEFDFRFSIRMISKHWIFGWILCMCVCVCGDWFRQKHFSCSVLFGCQSISSHIFWQKAQCILLF